MHDVRWPWSNPSRAELGEVRRRLDEVELDVVHLAKQLEKLRGRATGGIRKGEPEPDAEVIPGMPPGLDPISQRIWARRLKRVGG